MKKQSVLIAATLTFCQLAQSQWVTNANNTYHNNSGSVIIEPGLPTFIAPSAKLHVRYFNAALPFGILSDMSATNAVSPIALRGSVAVLGAGTGNPTGVSGSASTVNTGTAIGVRGIGSNTNAGTSGTAFGVSGEASLSACKLIPATPTAPSNYAIGLYGRATAPCTANAWALYADGPTFTPAGVWTASDERLKTNIRSISSALSIINNLQPKTYRFTNEARYTKSHLPQGEQYGFLAQEVEKVLPAAVTDAPLFLHNKGEENVAGATETIKAINYTALIPVLTQAIKEQQAMIETLQAEVKELKKERKAEAIAGAKLYQNQPNPFNNSTIIRYELPASVKQASLVVYDLQGKQVKQLLLGGRNAASVHLPAGELSAGMYYYTLMADGKEVETKKMIVTND
jgi:Chaperone of endosialidase/Secretion system C-terminal sorting domain